jgi:hypothetical protein
MTESVVNRRDFRASVLSSAARTSWDVVFWPTPNPTRTFDIPEENTVSSSEKALVRNVRPYSARELKMLEESDRLSPELQGQVRAFLEE